MQIHGLTGGVNCQNSDLNPIAENSPLQTKTTQAALSALVGAGGPAPGYVGGGGPAPGHVGGGGPAPGHVGGGGAAPRSIDA